MNESSKEQELLELLRAGNPDSGEVNKSSLRYALYARKSTPGEDRQSSSVGDQIKDCLERIATPQNLNVVKIYQENSSAKIADTREEFMKLLKDIQSGRIDGLISWHPDRLSRNMKEAGTIIDLVDRDLIKDLQFSTFTFENNPAGKMLLGITFVMAKQYSEHLSESVERGNRRAVEDGEFIGKFKHGYIVNGQRHFEPDVDNFIKVKHMFEMALDGKSQKDIRLWINEQDYKVQKLPGSNASSHVWSKDDVSDLIRDPHYAGVHKWGENLSNLVKLYDFQPMLSVDEFLKINKIDSLNASKVLTLKRRKTDTRADFLRGIVLCGECGGSLTSMIIDKKRGGVIYESRYYYKCETPECVMEGKSARAKLITDTVTKFFSDYLFVTSSNYAQYIAGAEKHLQKQNITMDKAIASLKVRTSNKEASYESAKKLIENDPKLQKHYDLDKILGELEELKQKYNLAVTKRRATRDALPSYEEYLKLLESTPVIMNKIRDMQQMDALVRIFFLNLTISPVEKGTYKGSNVEYKLKEPWNGFLSSNDFVRGAA